jgi:hypothetical protein
MSKRTLREESLSWILAVVLVVAGITLWRWTTWVSAPHAAFAGGDTSGCGGEGD